MKKKAQKLLKRSKRASKKRLKFVAKHPLLLPVSVFMAVIFFGLVSFVALGGTTEGARDRRIVNLYIDDEQQTLTTRAKTVGDLLQRLEVKLLDEDIVEPSRDSLIFEDNTQVNVYRARPVEVLDEDRTITVLTAQRAPRLVAAEAGLDLLPEDEAEFTKSEDSVLSSVAPEQLLVKRSIEVQLNIYGVVTSIRTTADTLGELLEEESIALAQGDSTQPESLDNGISDGQLVSVNRPGVTTESETEVIPFDTEYEDDDSLTVGESVVKREGRDGRRAVIYAVREKDGDEVRERIQSVVTRKAVTKIVARGTKPATLSSSIVVSDDKASLMAAAGISETDYPYVDFIISHESGWRPGAVNSSSGAYGLCQSLPASKMASAGADYLTNPVTQLRWCSGYASGRYGSWQGAYNAWLAQGWW